MPSFLTHAFSRRDSVGRKKIRHERLDHYHIDFILKPIRPKNLIGLFFEKVTLFFLWLQNAFNNIISPIASVFNDSFKID